GNFVWRSAWDIPELTSLTAKASMEPDAKNRGEIYVQIEEKLLVDRQIEPQARPHSRIGGGIGEFADDCANRIGGQDA
ncbi:hypothetical protein ACC687_42690, partial [Rhizobium ruizarguesonis]